MHEREYVTFCLPATAGKGASASAASDGPETGGFFRRGKVIKGKMVGMAVILRLVFLVFHTSGFGPRSAFVGTWSSRKRLQVRHQTLMLVQQQGGDDNTKQSDSFNKLYSMLVKLQDGQDGLRNDVVKLQVGQDGVRNDTSELRIDVVKILDTQKNLVGYNEIATRNSSYLCPMLFAII